MDNTICTTLMPAEGKPAQYLYGSEKLVPVQTPHGRCPVQTPHGRCSIEFTGREGSQKGKTRPQLNIRLAESCRNIPIHDPSLKLTGKVLSYCWYTINLLNESQRFVTLMDTNISDAITRRLETLLTAIHPDGTKEEQAALPHARSWLEICLSAVIWSLGHCQYEDPRWKELDHIKVADIKILETNSAPATSL